MKHIEADHERRDRPAAELVVHEDFERVRVEAEIVAPDPVPAVLRSNMHE